MRRGHSLLAGRAKSRWARSTRDAFAYLDAYFVGVRESSTLLFVDYMHQEVRFLTTEWERCKCVGFAHLQLLAEWRQQTPPRGRPRGDASLHRRLLAGARP